jgi:hypothetical protein
MKRVLILISVSLMLTGCVAYPVYDSGYYPTYGSYPYGYVGPSVSLSFSSFHGGHGFHKGGHGFRGGGHGHGGGYGHGGRR